MPPTVTPTGSIGKALCNLAWLVASSATFQTLVGATGPNFATSAMNSIYFEADDTGPAPRPRALVYFKGYTSSQVAQQTYNVESDMFVSFEFAPSAGVLNPKNAWNEAVEFCNRIDGILADMMVLEGTGSTGYIAGESYLSVHSFELLDGPGAVVETRGAGNVEARAYFWGATFAVHRRGR